MEKIGSALIFGVNPLKNDVMTALALYQRYVPPHREGITC
jgi:uncharacterized protein YaaN involved in tellurite resistance